MCSTEASLDISEDSLVTCAAGFAEQTDLCKTQEQIGEPQMTCSQPADWYQ
jgi:hypothetical protein